MSSQLRRSVPVIFGYSVQYSAINDVFTKTFKFISDVSTVMVIGVKITVASDCSSITGTWIGGSTTTGVVKITHNGTGWAVRTSNLITSNTYGSAPEILINKPDGFNEFDLSITNKVGGVYPINSSIVIEFFDVVNNSGSFGILEKNAY